MSRIGRVQPDFDQNRPSRGNKRRVPRSLDGSGDRGEGEKQGEVETPLTPTPLPRRGRGTRKISKRRGLFRPFRAKKLPLARRASGSRPISRVLSWTAIHLGCTSPHTSCDLPGSRAGRTTLPYLVLLRVGFTLPPVLPPARCALTAPFHPYRTVAGVAVYFLWHFP